jgi:predicted alpha/beta hydrolase
LDIREEKIALPEGSSLVARFFLPAQVPRASILVPSAMGVTQSYYSAFGQWLAAQGYLAATFDYRGMGLSAPRSLRELRVTIRDWANVDCVAMLESLKSRAPGAPLFVIGHSLGGQLIGMIPNRHLIDGVVIVASGSGYWRITAPPTKRDSLWMWHVIAPLLTPIFGYFPGKPIRVIGNLPRGVVEQWRRWCLHPEYMIGVEGDAVRADFAGVRTPMLSLSFTDDEMMSATSTEALHGFYANAPIERTRLAPTDIGVKRIGHFGFFRQQFEQSLWPLTTRWLEQRL